MQRPRLAQRRRGRFMHRDAIKPQCGGFPSCAPAKTQCGRLPGRLAVFRLRKSARAFHRCGSTNAPAKPKILAGPFWASPPQTCSQEPLSGQPACICAAARHLQCPQSNGKKPPDEVKRPAGAFFALPQKNAAQDFPVPRAFLILFPILDAQGYYSVAARTALMVCIRFSASSKTMERGDSKTSSLTSR